MDRPEKPCVNQREPKVEREIAGVQPQVSPVDLEGLPLEDRNMCQPVQVATTAEQSQRGAFHCKSLLPHRGIGKRAIGPPYTVSSRRINESRTFLHPYSTHP